MRRRKMTVQLGARELLEWLGHLPQPSPLCTPQKRAKCRQVKLLLTSPVLK